MPFKPDLCSVAKNVTGLCKLFKIQMWTNAKTVQEKWWISRDFPVFGKTEECRLSKSIKRGDCILFLPWLIENNNELTQIIRSNSASLSWVLRLAWQTHCSSCPEGKTCLVFVQKRTKTCFAHGACFGNSWQNNVACIRIVSSEVTQPGFPLRIQQDWGQVLELIQCCYFSCSANWVITFPRCNDHSIEFFIHKNERYWLRWLNIQRTSLAETMRMSPHM